LLDIQSNQGSALYLGLNQVARQEASAVALQLRGEFVAHGADSEGVLSGEQTDGARRARSGGVSNAHRAVHSHFRVAQRSLYLLCERNERMVWRNHVVK
jgi:hypothetical protein